MRKKSVMGFTVLDDSLDQIGFVKDRALMVNTISPNSYGITTKDPVFKLALQASDYLVLDGVYFALASIFLNGNNIRKNQGPDVFAHFMKLANDKKGKVFFLGASQATLDKIHSKSETEYPEIQIASYSPPYKSVFTEEDNEKMLQVVNEFEPDILFVGMTCPKQEKWVYENIKYLKPCLVCTIGAVFDWYAGNQKNIAPIWWRLRLAWLVRTIHRPEILKRYPNIFIFFKDLFFIRLGLKKKI